MKKKKRFIEYQVKSLFGAIRLFGELLKTDGFGNVKFKVTHAFDLCQCTRPKWFGLWRDVKMFWIPSDEELKIKVGETVTLPIEGATVMDSTRTKAGKFLKKSKKDMKGFTRASGF